MSTLDATVSMLEAMPEDARLKVFEFTQKLFITSEQNSPFVPLESRQILSDLAEARRESAAGMGIDMKEALDELGKKHGFI